MLLACAVTLAACGTATQTTTTPAPTNPVQRGRPQVVEPTLGQQGVPIGSENPTSGAPVGDPNAHAPPLSEVRQELKLELVAVRATNGTYINPLYYVTCCGHWERTDQGVDATMPIGAPILAPCEVKILDIEPGWYAGQPLVYFELLTGPDAGRVQYVAEQITDVAEPGTILQQKQPIARFAPSGTGIEYGWSTPNGITLAVATTGYEEGEITPAGRSMRAWLNALGANAGPDF